MGETRFILGVNIALVPQVKKMNCYYFWLAWSLLQRTGFP